MGFALIDSALSLSVLSGMVVSVLWLNWKTVQAVNRLQFRAAALELAQNTWESQMVSEPPTPSAVRMEASNLPQGTALWNPPSALTVHWQVPYGVYGVETDTLHW